VERDHIVRALEASDWVVGGKNGAAARLGMKFPDRGPTAHFPSSISAR
jgi:hypothetical protein